MDPVIRPIAPADQEDALALWETVFAPGRGYFERYFAVDPWYREGDCFGTWVEGRLASAVHVCRRPVRWEGLTLWCGAIANVATLADFRQRGLSRELLRQSVRRMEEERMDFSMLFTGRYGHYEALGWEQVRTPGVTVTLSGCPASPLESVSRQTAPDLDLCGELYAKAPTPPLLLERPPVYFRGWVGWNWEQGHVTVHVLPGSGYLASKLPAEADRPLRVVELRALDAAAESLLLQAAAMEARAHGRDRLVLELIPPQAGLLALGELGEVEEGAAGGMMLRNVSLPEAEYTEIRRLYAAGEAVWWSSDGF